MNKILFALILIPLISSVQNASSVSWDLGDGRTSESNQLVLSYPKSGTHKVTLTAKAAKNAGGEYWLASNNASAANQTINFIKPRFNRLLVTISFFSEIEMYLNFE